jgi:high-affinity nickel-transport protein
LQTLLTLTQANDASGYVGAAIVGCFVVILVVYHAARWWWRKRTPSVGAVALPAGGEV